MVGADHLVAKAHVGARPQKQRAIVGHAIQEVIRVTGHHLHMLGGELVGLGQHFLIAVADDDLAIDLPGLAGNGSSGQYLELALDFGHGVAGQFFRGGQQHCRRGGAVLGLPQQVHRAHFAIDRVVGNHQGLGRAGKQVDANPAIQLALGLGHKHIARPHQHVYRRHRFSANGHGRHRLHAAQHQNLVSPGKVHGRHNGRVRCALIGRRGRHHAGYAGHFGGQNAHVR